MHRVSGGRALRRNAGTESRAQVVGMERGRGGMMSLRYIPGKHLLSETLVRLNQLVHAPDQDNKILSCIENSSADIESDYVTSIFYSAA